MQLYLQTKTADYNFSSVLIYFKQKKLHLNRSSDAALQLGIKLDTRA